VGGLLGEAYQVADDLADALGEAERLGKPIHQDGNKARPNLVAKLGIDGAVRQLDALLDQAMRSLPECRGRESVEDFLRLAAERLCPPALRRKDSTAESTEGAETGKEGVSGS
jgi:geranylgeranyl diphosphate synthase type II